MHPPQEIVDLVERFRLNLPLSILTDFEEFAVYDCRIRPVKTDKPSTARVMYFTFDEYIERWDEIAGIFSKEAVLQGSFDRYARSSRRKRGTAEVDTAFLAEIEHWREMLARVIALRNPGLSVRDLNFAVQRTIDRIIFLRIAEDRGLEPYDQLRNLVKSKNTYRELCRLYAEADNRYNSGLFHFKSETGRHGTPDELTLNLAIDDKVIDDILNNLYYPDSPYEFSVLPADLLGQVYEQFLGKVIRLTPGGRAKVEDKPDVKKAGGVYYTPTYIVDYIVSQTVGKLLEGKTPREVTELRICDPACGSGSFLLGAYQTLLDWHRDYYVENGAEKYTHAARGRIQTLYQGAGGEWRLTTAEKRRILLNNIYGVDIDPQAVEVTKLSLLLKVLEGENQGSLDQQLAFFQERALPDLGSNIKCGNSLIGPDFYQQEGMQTSMFDTEELYRINAFDWGSEFPHVFATGGFDAVIGNPPYGIVFDETIKPYLEKKYNSFIRNNDTYVAFIHKSIVILKPSGFFGFIIPNTLLLGPYYNLLKQNLLKKTTIISVVDFGNLQIFKQPNVFTMLLFFRKKGGDKIVSEYSTKYFRVADIVSFPSSLKQQYLSNDILDSLRWTPSGPIVDRLLKLEPKLGEIAWVKDVGLNYWTKGRGKKRGGSIADRVLYCGERQHSLDKPYLKGRDIGRYNITFGNNWLRHDYKSRLNPKVDTFRYSPDLLKRRKIVYRQTADHIISTIDEEGMLTNKTVHLVILKDGYEYIGLKFLLGLLNSTLLSFLYKALSKEEGRTFAQVKIFRIKALPIVLPDFNNPIITAIYEKMVSLVERMLALHKSLAAAKTPTEKEMLQRQIDTTDRQIDELVYELYGLTEEERRIVEGEGNGRE